MQRYPSWVQDQFGNAVEGATVTVYLFGTSTKAVIYDAATATAAIDNPITVGSDGFYSFAAENDRYDITISATGYASKTLYGIYLYDGLTGTAGTGTVTSVGMTVPSFLSVAGSPVTGAGTLAVTLATQSANKIFAGPTTGAAAAPTFRDMVLADLGSLIAIPVTVPTFMSASDATLGPQDTLGLSFNTQAANLFLASAVSGGVAVPAFRAIVAADLPTFVASGGSHAKGAVPDPPSTAGTSKYLREDATWAGMPFTQQFEMTPPLAYPAVTTGSNQSITPTGVGSLTIGANTLKVGSRVSVYVRLKITAGAGTHTSFDCRLAAGGSWVSNGVLNAAESTGAYEIEFDFLVTSATNYDYMAIGKFGAVANGRASGASNVTYLTTPGSYSSFDITIANDLSFRYTINTAAITSASIERCEVKIYNPA